MIKKPEVYSHYLSKRLIAPQTRLEVVLIGAGGSGSVMATGLARINAVLEAKGQPGLMLHVFDGDKIGRENVGRQLYSSVDIGSYKSDCLVSRLNMFFGLSWKSHPYYFTQGGRYRDIRNADIVITCVDRVAARQMVFDAIQGTDIYHMTSATERISDNLCWGRCLISLSPRTASA